MKHLKFFIGLLVGVFVLWGLNWLFMLKPDPAWRNNLGGMFGVASSLFSGLAFAGIVYTIYLQQRELKTAGQSQRRAHRYMVRQTEVLNHQFSEMVTQRRLSVLPFFVAYIYEELDENSQVEECLRFRNVGKGIALNLVARPFTANFRGLDPGLIAVHLHGHRPIVRPDEETTADFYLAPPERADGKRSKLKDRVWIHEVEMQYLHFQIAFADIEGRLCSQSIYMNQGFCYPAQVEVVTPLEGELGISNQSAAPLL
jgi:hypothetical protein